MFCFQSGKLVTRMFQKIQDLIDDKDALVFVLIDEVGALRPDRAGGRAGPSGLLRLGHHRPPTAPAPTGSPSCRPCHRGPSGQAVVHTGTRAPTRLSTLS